VRRIQRRRHRHVHHGERGRDARRAAGEAHARVRDWRARALARPAVRREAESMGAYAAKALAGAARS
jgi:hypothetical protein